MKIRIIKAIIRWLIQYLPGYHLHRDPQKVSRNIEVVKAVQEVLGVRAMVDEQEAL